MGNIIVHPSRNTSLTRFIKAHVYHITHGKTIHFVGITKPKGAQLQSPSEPTQPTHKSQQLEIT